MAVENSSKKPDIFATNLQNLIKHHSITHKKLAKIIGVARGYLTQLVNNTKSNPSAKILKKMAEVFQVSVSQLLGEQKIDFKNKSKELEFDHDEE